MISYIFNFVREDISSAYRLFRQQWIDDWNNLPKSYQYRMLLAFSIVGFLWLLFSAIAIYYLFLLIPWDAVASFFVSLHTFLTSDDGMAAIFALAGLCCCLSAIFSVLRLSRY
ncbi:MAG: hypothetical protein D3906_09850 [Candidatus Electrothrix sp. AUS1_2]|nr:hypothetical protein [Candidatus Electrothrix sp. AUS1_2]